MKKKKLLRKYKYCIDQKLEYTHFRYYIRTLKKDDEIKLKITRNDDFRTLRPSIESRDSISWQVSNRWGHVRVGAGISVSWRPRQSGPEFTLNINRAAVAIFSDFL